MNIITINCVGMDSREKLHSAFSDALCFPTWYGRNLDALHDCLTGIREDTILQLQDWNAASVLGGYHHGATKVLEHAASENPNLTVEFL